MPHATCSQNYDDVSSDTSVTSTASSRLDKASQRKNHNPWEDNFEASQCNDEEENVEPQQHHYTIAPGSEVDKNVMAHVKHIFYEEFCPIYQKAREGHSQMVDKNVYNRYVNIVRTYPMLPKDDRDPYRKSIYNKFEIKRWQCMSASMIS
jgi:hypothetical protein